MKSAVFLAAFSAWLLTPAAYAGHQTPQTPSPGTSQPPQSPAPTPAPGGTVFSGPGRGRPVPPQPQQKQGPDYLAGTWAFTWTGRESAVTIGPRSGTVTFARQGDLLDITSEGTAEGSGVRFRETGSAQWNEAAKSLSFKEALSNGVQLAGVGDWSSSLAIRYQSEPVRIGTQTVRVRRVYSIVAPHAFTLDEELSVDGGPYQRLGKGTFTRK